jgi:hypothetical protein
MDIQEEQRQRATESAKHPVVFWVCTQCNQNLKTGNCMHKVRCKCGYWMQWLYPGKGLSLG